MATQTVTFEVPEEQLRLIDEIASNLEADRGAALREAVEMYLADYADLKADLEQADREIEAGEFVNHEDVVAWLEAQHPPAKASEAA